MKETKEKQEISSLGPLSDAIREFAESRRKKENTDEAKNQADAAYFKPGAEELDAAAIAMEAEDRCSDPIPVQSVGNHILSASSLVSTAETPVALPLSLLDNGEVATRLPVATALAQDPQLNRLQCHTVASNGQGLVNVPPPPSGQPSTLASRLAAQLNRGVATITPKGGKTPTAEQQAILELASDIMTGRNTSKVGVFEAGAGTGKTTTFRMLADILPGTGQYVTFTAALTDESKVKFHGTRVQCNTIHSLAFRAIGHKYSERLNGPRIRSEQVAKMLGIQVLSVQRTTIDEATGDRITKPHNLAPGFLASQVMGAIRKFSMSADKEVSASHFKYIDVIDLPSVDGRRSYTCNEQVRDYLLPFAQKAWKDLCNPEGHLPFIHDHYVKMWELDKPVISANYLLSDESQDVSPVMLSIFEQQDIPKFLVGDSAQSIYEWRGAVNAMAAFPDAPRLFLSQSFRFGPAIADVANAVLETLEEATPLRLKGFDQINSVVAPMTDYKAILCRTNAVAVGRLLAAIADGKAPFLVGGGADVIAFVKAAKELQQGLPTNHPELACFESWPGVQAYVKDEEGEDLKLLVNLIDAFGCDPIISALENMPPEKDADLIISTSHRSKGREWDSVKIERDFPTLSKASDAEKKLLYVAVTRAKLALDVSECPFFTGQDALDLSEVIKPADYQPIIAPTPSRAPEVTEFTWSKRGEKWMVRGPAGFVGKEVEVKRKDGSSAKKRLVSVEAEYSEATLYNAR